MNMDGGLVHKRGKWKGAHQIENQLLGTVSQMEPKVWSVGSNSNPTIWTSPISCISRFELHGLTN